MNIQLHSSMKTTPYEVAFGIKPSLEPEPTLKVLDEPADDSGDNTDLSDRSCDTSFACTNNSEGII